MNVMELCKTNPAGFSEKLKAGEIKVSVHGQGYVGLPLSVLLAIKGVRVIGVSKDKKAIEKIRKGESPIFETDPNSLLERGAEMIEDKCIIDGVRMFKYEGKIICPMCLRVYEVGNGHPVMMKESVDLRGKLKTLSDYLKEALESGNYEITDDNAEATKKTHIHVITVPTYADNYSIVLKVCEEIAGALERDGDVIIDKSTVPVGATDEAEALMKKRTKHSFGMCHMQERIAEGRALKDFKEIPRTVGSHQPEANRAAKIVFEVLGSPVFEYSDPRITEASKVFENSFRDCNIAIANDFALFCEKMGIDVYQVIDAANTHIKANIYQPGMVGGHCLPEDTYYVAKPMEGLRGKNVIMAGRKLNEHVPYHAVDLMENGLKERGKRLKGSKICLFGVAFKGNTDDIRLSGALFISEELKKRGAEVLVYDPWVRGENQKTFGKKVGLEEALDGDGIIIAADHTEFYGIDYTKGNYGVLVDVRNIVDRNKLRGCGKKIIKFGVGTK